MRTDRRKFCCALLLLLAAGFAAAEVYYLTPRRGGGGLAGRQLTELTGAKELLAEPIVFNGAETELKVSLLKRPLLELLEELRTNYPELEIQARPGGVLLKLPVFGGKRERVLLVGSEERGSVTMFTMLLPEKMPPLPEWPEELPQPTGTKAEEIIYFRKSRAYYAGFSDAGDPVLALQAIGRQLRYQGFVPAGSESAGLTAAARGEIFVREKPPAVLWVNFDDRGNGAISLTPF